jgi:3-oxo-5-alpha-steroid 4-dehydrogenase 1
MSSIYFKVGIITFFVGMYINIQSDDILMKLRSSSSTGVKEYKIPRGGMFEYVSSANYCKTEYAHVFHFLSLNFVVGEIVEWTGFAICSWSLTGAAFALYTFACLAPRAVKVMIFLSL